MQVQTRLTTGVGVAVLNNCYAPLTKIPEKYERAITLHRDNRREICGQRSHTCTVDGPWEILEEGIRIRGQSPTRLHTRTLQKSCMESVESYCPYGKLWTIIYCEGKEAASCRHNICNRWSCDIHRDETYRMEILWRNCHNCIHLSNRRLPPCNAAGITA